MNLYYVRDWQERYETHESRKLKSLAWVPTPNKHDGLGFRTMAAKPDRCELFAAWNLIIQVASKSEPKDRRGYLERDGEPITPEQFELITGFPRKIFEKAIEFFSSHSVKWLVAEPCDSSAGTPGESAGTPGESAGTPGNDAGKTPANGREWNGRERMEGNGKSCPEPGIPASAPEASPVVLWFDCSGVPDKWPLTQAMIDGWVEAYPAVDVLAECRKAKAWEDSNPKNRKTFDGHARFLNAWMSKAQNQARTVPAQGQPAAAPEKPRGTWDLQQQIDGLSSERDRLNRRDFENTSGREAYPEQWAKVQELNAKIRALRDQIAGKV